MSAAEFALWLEFYRANGFDADRLEWATANGAAAVVQSWGGKAKPADLIPRFRPPDVRAKRAVIMAFFDRLASDKAEG